MANKDQSIGAVILILCLLGIVIYGWLVFLSEWCILTLKVTAFLAMLLIFGIGSWIGWTMATTPPPKPIEELEEAIRKEESEEIEIEGTEESNEEKE